MRTLSHASDSFLRCIRSLGCWRIARAKMCCWVSPRRVRGKSSFPDFSARDTARGITPSLENIPAMSRPPRNHQFKERAMIRGWIECLITHSRDGLGR